MIYNERYAEVAGTKHPAILGKRYDVGWAEVWSQIECVLWQQSPLRPELLIRSPFVARAYAGHTTYYTDSAPPFCCCTFQCSPILVPMFLRRKGFLEECFFFWYMAPIYTIVDGEPVRICIRPGMPR
jgi:hypothetical protein